MRQLLAMLSEWRAELLRTAFSMMMHSRPILIDPPSAITCAPNMTRQFGPIETLPQITAFGATQAAGSIRGVAPSCLMIIWHLRGYPGEHKPIVDEELWNAVQARLSANLTERRQARIVSGGLLAGVIFDDRGHRMSPTYTVRRGKPERVLQHPSAIARWRATF